MHYTKKEKSIENLLSLHLKKVYNGDWKKQLWYVHVIHQSSSQFCVMPRFYLTTEFQWKMKFLKSKCTYFIVENFSAKYFRTGKMIRLVAAKHLFNSFATRTQAYKLHHALGLTIFGSRVIVKLELSKDTEKFEVKSGKVIIILLI